MFNIASRVVILLAIILFSVTANAKVFTEGWKQVGVTSFYHRGLNGNLTANGERYRHYNAMTAAHRTLPFGTKVQVTDKDTGKSIVVRINDRGPFHGNRVLDLSGKAAETLGITKRGVCDVEVKILSLPDKYLAKTRQVVKPARLKPSPNIDGMIDSELASIKRSAVFPQSRIDSIEELIGRVVR